MSIIRSNFSVSLYREREFNGYHLQLGYTVVDLNSLYQLSDTISIFKKIRTYTGNNIENNQTILSVPSYVSEFSVRSGTWTFYGLLTIYNRKFSLYFWKTFVSSISVQHNNFKNLRLSAINCWISDLFCAFLCLFDYIHVDDLLVICYNELE